MSKLIRRLGVHTSIAGGIHISIERARELGCNTVQIFSHNPRQWTIKKIPEDSISSFKGLRKLYDINPVFVHTSYLINLAASNNDILEKSIEMLIQEMDIADSLNADYVILHTGSASDCESAGRRKAIESLREVSKERIWKAKLLLENTAGERGDISSKIEDLAEIANNANSRLIGGVCIDTCHAFAAGYDISREQGLSEFIEKIKECIGIERIRLIHLNDSKKAYGSNVDRHEHIGKGSIGREGLKRFINHPAFKHIPLILETPKKAGSPKSRKTFWGVGSEEDDIKNLKRVRFLI